MSLKEQINSKKREEWIQEFTEFCQSSFDDAQVPQGLRSKISLRLFPNPWAVFSKIAAVHCIVGFLSLSVCHQFDLNPFNTSYSLMDFWMKTAGHSWCMIFCGVFFVATTYLMANFFLSLEELESVRRHKWMQLGTLSLASLAVFYFFGAELIGVFVGLWILGVLFGGILSIEGSFRFRRQLSFSSN